ncbi:hypothetical protein POUND7_001260 [Theobroma cacao]
MALQIRQLIQHFIIVFSLFSRYNALKEDPRYNYYKEVVAGYDPQAYPSYVSTLEDGEFKDLIRPSAEVLSLSRLGEVDIITSTSTKTVNVDDFGATGDGDDDTQAFEEAWKEACSSKGTVVLEVPEGKSYLLRPVRFSGPCKSNLTIQIYGTIEASDDRSDYKEDSRHWLIFDSVHNLLVEGGGNINGNGKIWWQNSCKINKDLPCKDAPTALTFYKSKNLVVKDLNIQDAQKIHVSFDKCTNVQASNLTVTAPEKSPNTDGIHVTHTQNIQITNSVIGTGDDCISIVSESQNVQAMDISCGPGHGISIGSLGSRNSRAYVSGVTVDRAKLSGTTNGVRIKTWQASPALSMISMICVQSSAVQVKNVLYKNIKGTSASEVAIKFDCSESHPCQGIVLQNVYLQEQGHETAKAICNNVKLSEEDVFPQCP